MPLNSTVYDQIETTHGVNVHVRGGMAICWDRHRASTLGPMGPARRPSAGWEFCGVVYGIYGVDMTLSKTDQFKILVVGLAKESIQGSRLLASLKGWGHNEWRATIDLAAMVRDELIEVVKGKYDTEPGKTRRRVFRTTEKGLTWAAVKETASRTDVIDLTPAVELAMGRPGRWVPLPIGVGEKHMAEMARRGFQVKVVIKFDDDDSSDKAKTI